MEEHRAEVSDNRRDDPDRHVVRFTGNADTDTGHRRKGHVCKRRHYSADEEKDRETRDPASAEGTSVIKHVLDGRKTKRYDTRKNDPVENVVKITAKAEEKNEKADTF